VGKSPGVSGCLADFDRKTSNSSLGRVRAQSRRSHNSTHLFAPGHLSVMMYSTILQSLIMLRVAFVRMRAGESHAQYSIVMPAKNTECKAMREKPTETL
jgi:hypothetical protein